MTREAVVAVPDIVQSPWMAGPCAARGQKAVVSFTDVQARSAKELEAIADLGTDLAKTWPVMQGAVGLWLWARPTTLRGGSVSVWEGPGDLRRFVQWPVHAGIMVHWLDRVTVVSQSWDVSRFDPGEVWARAEELIRRPHEAECSGRAP